MAFTRRQQHTAAKSTEHEAVEPHDDDAVATAAELSDDEASETPTAAKSEPKIEEIEVADVVAVVEEKLVTIVPHVTLTSCRIGPKMYSFLKGVPVKVPAGVRAHLQEKGIC